MAIAPAYSGKVRDIYDVGDGRLLMVASDRISAFDRVFAEPIPDKGRVLTAMTAFWSEELAGIAPTHLITTDPGAFPPEAADIGDVAGRAMLVRRAEMLPIECIVRGYLAGSAWKEYRATQTMHGTPLPAGLRESDRLPEPVFTPSTKATEGHDVNISFEEAVELVGARLAARAREISLRAYAAGARRALERGIVIADTKFELGLIDGELAICDEILTPDSSRFWPADAWSPGSAPPSFDKQPVRDWAESTGWDKESPPPPLPAEVVAATRDRYVAAYEKISERRFADWWGVAPCAP
ncbi:MAG TPA: phosphoribosylaminoimidazolesuccinocarboxamide synthase [Acidimicrobiales bacterium]|jgi:phosphoribosylaminoimidazole-succinocarboxamide synthase|nr:phosphoribosylaminoimidazolesuccinocarboxamide synthase [Acidimicrobiales bacterium]